GALFSRPDAGSLRGAAGPGGIARGAECAFSGRFAEAAEDGRSGDAGTNRSRKSKAVGAGDRGEGGDREGVARLAGRDAGPAGQRFYRVLDSTRKGGVARTHRSASECDV